MTYGRHCLVPGIGQSIIYFSSWGIKLIRYRSISVCDTWFCWALHDFVEHIQHACFANLFMSCASGVVSLLTTVCLFTRDASWSVVFGNTSYATFTQFAVITFFLRSAQIFCGNTMSTLFSFRGQRYFGNFHVFADFNLFISLPASVVYLFWCCRGH